MKPNKIDSFVRKFDYLFARVVTYIGCSIGLLVVFMFVVNKDPQGVNLVPVAKLFFDAAKISVELQQTRKKSAKLANKVPMKQVLPPWMKEDKRDKGE